MRRIIVIGLVALLLPPTAASERGDDFVSAESVPQRPLRWERYRYRVSDDDEILRGRFAQVIERCGELAAKDEPPETPEMQRALQRLRPAPDGTFGGDSPERFPRQSHIAEYERVRPWTWYYGRWVHRHDMDTVPISWPTAEHAPNLRRLLEEEEPAIRSLAIEALATIHDPEDAPRLARFLADEGQGAPFLERYWSLESVGLHFMPWGLDPDVDNLKLLRAWRSFTVGQYARRALYLMTGKRFEDEGEFNEWWALNSDARNRLWYWEQRLARELGEAEVSVSGVRVFQRPDENYERYLARQAALEGAAVAHVCETIAAELGQLDPEVEAKVLLLIDRYGDSSGSRHEIPFWSQPPDVRLSPERLLDMLDRKDLCREETELYWRLVNRLGRWAPDLFEAKDVPRLKAVLEREGKAIRWRARGSLVVGISRLLPPAKLTEMDSPETREGFLRQWIQEETEVFFRGAIAAELARVSVAGNEDFLTELALGPQMESANPNVAGRILRVLSEPPLTSAKRNLLIELLLDPRFEHRWTQLDGTNYANVAAKSLNAHAGEFLIDRMLLQRLRDPEQAEEAMTELRAILRGQLAAEAIQG